MWPPRKVFEIVFHDIINAPYIEIKTTKFKNDDAMGTRYCARRRGFQSGQYATHASKMMRPKQWIVTQLQISNQVTKKDVKEVAKIL